MAKCPPPEAKPDADEREVRKIRATGITPPGSTAREPAGPGRPNTPGSLLRSRTSGWAANYRITPPPQDGEAQSASSNIEFWDFAPPQEYFDELFRVSRNQIIWGGNYFSLPPTRCFLVWRKLTIAETFTMAMCEYAWTSFNANAKLFECAPQGNAREKRFHPTQKPVKLYTWCLGLFAKPGDRLLDTHGGSMSSAVAAWQLGFDMDICEANDFYFQMGRERVEKEMRQPNLF